MDQDKIQPIDKSDFERQLPDLKTQNPHPKPHARSSIADVPWRSIFDVYDSYPRCLPGSRGCECDAILANRSTCDEVGLGFWGFGLGVEESECSV